jgi:sn1-specific diacylglycerol lipase
MVYCLAASTSLLRVYVLGYMAIAALCFVCEFAGILISLSGTVKDPGLRNWSSTFVYLELILLFIDLAWQVFGLFCLVQIPSFQNQTLISMVVIWSFVVKMFVLLVTCAMYHVSIRDSVGSNINSYINVWQRRLEWMFSKSTSRKRESAQVINELSSQFAKYFDVDWAPSDVAVGLILLKREQKIVREATEVVHAIKSYGKSSPIFTTSFKELESRNDVTIDIDHVTITQCDEKIEAPSIVDNGSRRSFSPFTSRTAAQHALLKSKRLSRSLKDLNLLEEKESNLPEIVPSLRPSGSFVYPESFNPEPMQDSQMPHLTRSKIRDVFHFAHYAEMAYVSLNPEIKRKSDLMVHFSTSNDLFRSPFIVSLDYDWKAIVVSIRGTYSLDDLLVDLKHTPSTLDGENDVLVHSGMLLTAKNITAELLKERILDKYLLDSKSATSMFDIVIAGHSLGAGVGALVAYLLRKAGYIRTRCYAFAPSGSFTNQAGLFEEFCVSVVTGDCIVSRLSQHSLEIVKTDIMRLLSRCDQPKYQILGSVLKNSVKGKSEKTKAFLKRMKNGIPDPSIDINPLKLVPKDEFEKIKQTTKSLPIVWRGGKSLDEQDEYPLRYLPGKILYIEKIRDFAARFHVNLLNQEFKTTHQSHNESVRTLRNAIQDGLSQLKERVRNYKYLYVPRWAKPQEFTQIIISRSMFSDHFAFGILNEFEAFPLDKPLVTTS